MAACFASRGHRVIGVDVNPRTISLMNQGASPVFEPGLDDVLRENRDRISATDDYDEAIARSSMSFITVPTPSDERGGFSLKWVLPAVERIGDALRKKSGFHLVVVTSTVLPGATRQEVLPVLESRSNKRCGPGFGLCYNPEFIALGSVIRDIFNPDFVLIGEYDKQSGDVLAAFYRTICQGEPPIARMNIVNAELTKIAVNTYVTTKISYANMLTEICERLPGADVDVVTSALGLDTRIGRKYIRGALGYGGPCFPRDNVALAHLARQLGLTATLAEATDAINRRQVDRLEERVMSRLPQGGTVGILGLSYKPGTNVVERSQGLELARSLLKRRVSVLLYDPAAADNARQALGPEAAFAPTLEECVRQASVVVIATPWPEFTEIKPSYLTRHSAQPTIIDCWRILNPGNFWEVADYTTLGVGDGPVCGPESDV